MRDNSRAHPKAYRPYAALVADLKAVSWTASALGQRNSELIKALDESVERVEKLQRRNKKMKRKLPSVREYRAYLKTARWRAMRHWALELHGDECAQCGESENLQIHHKTYANLFKEMPDDLEVLCSGCHRTAHEDDPDLTPWNDDEDNEEEDE